MGETQFACGRGTPWAEGETSDCTHAYSSPSLGTGPGGEDHYRILARRRHMVVCNATVVGRFSTYLPGGCNTQMLGNLAGANLPVVEGQSVNR